jgi:ribosomal protein S18 acetylase RimI-like enzyme
MGSGPELDPTDVMVAADALGAELQRRIDGFDGLVAPDVTLASHGLPIARMNQASGARFAPGTAAGRIEDVIAWYEQRQLPFSWQVGPRDRPRDLGERLLTRGFRLDPEDMPGMVRSLRDLPAQRLPDSAAMEVVRGASSFREWVDVVGEGFGMPPEIPAAILKYEALGFDEDLGTLVLARLDGRPVATALGLVAGGGVAIANVTTLAQARGRGLGRAVTLAAMKLALDMGAEIAVLLATEMGFSVYRGLGFETFGRYRNYIWEPSAT